MTQKQKSTLAILAAIPSGAGLVFFLLNAVFQTDAAATTESATLRLEQREAMDRHEIEHGKEYDRVICELEAIRRQDNRVCP